MDRFCPNCQTPMDGRVCPACGVRTKRGVPSDEERALPNGHVLSNRYRIDSLIGTGGMGVVYRGVQLATGQIVAIKVIRSRFRKDPVAVTRFKQEAEAASLLKHPHTVRVMDFDESIEGHLFTVLEYLEGKTLGHVLMDEGAISQGRTAKIGLEAAQSLAEAHAAGVIHRDLNPSNIMLVRAYGDPEFVKILDFGIAKFVAGTMEARRKLTPTGEIIGTPHFLAPELTSGGTIGPTVDVYALGVTLYVTLTGRFPFTGGTPLEVILAHAKRPVPEIGGPHPVSKEMQTLVRALLAKTPRERPTAADLVKELTTLRAGTQGDTSDDPTVLMHAVERPTERPADPLPATRSGRPSPLPVSQSIHIQDTEKNALPPVHSGEERPSFLRRRWRWVVAGLVLTVAIVDVVLLALVVNWD